MHYVRQGSFVSRDGTNIAAGRLCREREREREEGEGGRSLQERCSTQLRIASWQVGGWPSCREGVAGGPWHALVRVGCLRQARETKLGDKDWHEDRTKMEGLLSPMRTKVGEDVNVFWSCFYPRRGRGGAGLALWIGGLPSFCLFSLSFFFFFLLFQNYARECNSAEERQQSPPRGE